MSNVPHRFEERIAKHPVLFSGPVEAGDAVVEGGGVEDATCDRVAADAFDHGGESVFRKPFDVVGAAGVDVDHAGGDAAVAVSGAGEERVELAADVGVAARAGLEFDERGDGF